MVSLWKEIPSLQGKCAARGVVFFTAPGVEGAGGFPRRSKLPGGDGKWTVFIF